MAFSARLNFVFSHEEVSVDTLRLLVSRLQSMVDGVSIRRTEMLKRELPAEYRIFRNGAYGLCDAIN